MCYGVTMTPTRAGLRSCSTTADPDAGPSGWPKTRILFLLAGTFTLAGTALAAGVSHWFALLPAAVGANQLLFVATGWCPASALLDRLRPGVTNQAPAEA